MSIRSTNDFFERLWIAAELGQRLPQLRDDSLYHQSILHFCRNEAYKFIIADYGTSSASLEDADAFGFVTFYPLPMSGDGHILAVEAFWFKSNSLDAQLPVWSTMASLAQRMQFHGVCISTRSINTPSSLEE